MSRTKNYRAFFTKDFLMGPNSLRLLDRLLAEAPWPVRFDRTLDLGCGMALTTQFIARETDARQVFAYDLWVCATDNERRIRQWGLADRIIPLHGDAMDMPFAHEWFDAIVSVDAYHYFGSREGVFTGKILPCVKPGGDVLIAIPGLKAEPVGALKELFHAWAEGDDAALFRTPAWWQELLTRECGDACDVQVRDAGFCPEAWQDWYATGHEFALRDKAFLDQGLDQILNFVLIYVKKKPGAEG